MSGHGWLMMLVFVAALGAVLSSCDPVARTENNARRTATQSAPASQPASAPTPATTPTTQPAATQPTTQSKPATQPIDALPPTPEYLRILERAAAGKKVSLDVKIEGTNTLKITSDNVERIRLTRKNLPLPRGKSVAIMIDLQGIEWTASTEIVELERSANGAWNIVRTPTTRP